MLTLVNVGVIVVAFVATLSCHLISPYVCKRTWRRYHELSAFERCKSDRYLGTVVAVVPCFALGLKAFISDADFHQLSLVGSSTAGNAALGIMIGQLLSDFLYEKKLDGTFGSIRNVGHHLAAIGFAVVGYNFFHRFLVYRIIHLISFPTLIIYDLMRKCDTKGRLFECVMQVNLLIFFLFRVVVIPFHWGWYIYEIVTGRDEWPEISLLAWIVMFASSVVIDYINCIWAKGLLKNYREETDAAKEKEN